MNAPSSPVVPSPIPPPSLWRRMTDYPSTKWGWWSLRLAIAFVVLLAIFFALVASGQRGGDSIFSNLLLAFSMLPAAAAALAGGAAGSVAIIWKKERSLFVFLMVLVGLFVLAFAVGEILGHR